MRGPHTQNKILQFHNLQPSLNYRAGSCSSEEFAKGASQSYAHELQRQR
jgi:hypothetical protein